MPGGRPHPVRRIANLLGGGSRHGDAPAAGLRESDVAKAAGLAGAQIVANVVAVAFTIVFARALGTQGYGSLARMISIFVILIVLGSALQVATARETALGRMGTGAECAATLERWTRGLLIATAAVAVVSVLLRQQIADAMRVDQVWAAALVAPTGALWVVVAVQRGVLQGLRAYKPVGLSLVGEQLVRLLLSGVFVAAGWGVTGALIGMPASVLVVVIALGVVLRRRLGPPAAEPSGERLRDLVMRNRVPIAALTLLAVMQNIDVVVVGHTLSSDESGAYAVAAVAAKGVVWVAVGLGLFLLPEATRESSVGSDPRPLLWRTLAVLAVVAVPMVAVYAVAAEPVLRTVFGADAVLADGALAWLGAAMSLLAVSYLAVQFQIALQRARFLWLLALGAVAEPVLLALIGGHLVPIALGLLGLQVALAGGLVGISAVRGPRRPGAGARAGAPPGPGAGARVIARAALAAVAAAVIVWLALGLHASGLEADAVDVASPRNGRAPGPAQVAQARKLLREARSGNLGTAPQVLEGQLEVFAGRPEAAVAVLRGVVADEPDNYEAWLLLARAAATVDPGLAARAQARLAALSPPVPAAP